MPGIFGEGDDKMEEMEDPREEAASDFIKAIKDADTMALLSALDRLQMPEPDLGEDIGDVDVEL